MDLLKGNTGSHSINLRGKLLSLDQPLVMGILNITPDSFSDGGAYITTEAVLKQTEKMIHDGAGIIDIGPQSSRPHAQKISSQEEIQRLGKIISSIKKEFPKIVLSLDSFYAETIRFAFEEGIDIVNDISAGQYDEKLLPTVAELGLPYILMHVNPTYSTMHEKLIKDDILLEVNRFFSQKIQELKALGIKDIILDPGFGFGKTQTQNEQLLQELEFIGFREYSLLVGISRKSFIYKPLGKSPLECNERTQELHMMALKKGAKILRVHDVKEAQKTIEIFLGEQ